MLLVLVTGGLAADLPETEYAEFDLHGDTKAFFMVTLPYDHLLMPETASGQGTVTGASSWRSAEVTCSGSRSTRR